MQLALPPRGPHAVYNRSRIRHRRARQQTCGLLEASTRPCAQRSGTIAFLYPLVSSHGSQETDLGWGSRQSSCLGKAISMQRYGRTSPVRGATLTVRIPILAGLFMHLQEPPGWRTQERHHLGEVELVVQSVSAYSAEERRPPSKRSQTYRALVISLGVSIRTEHRRTITPRDQMSILESQSAPMIISGAR